jgi:parallel beta-helix repeat protein
MTTGLYKKGMVLGIICLFLGAGVVPSIGENNINGFGDTIIVPDDYPTLQEAIDNAKNGDTIQVRAGLYRERIIIDKSINLIGENKFNTIIKGNISGTVVNVTAENVDINGFEIRHSGGDNLNWAGIEINASFVTISDCYIRENQNGVSISNASNVIISDNVFDHDYWAGIRCHYQYENYNILIDNNIIRNSNIFGIDFCEGHNSNIISNNFIYQCDVGMYLFDFGNNTIYDNTIMECSERGIHLIYPPSVNNTFYHNNFINNTIHVKNETHSDWVNYFYNDKLKEGNFWDDYTGTDSDGDGIGDTPYNIPDRGYQDLYPLMEVRNKPPNKPDIICPTNGKAGIQYDITFTSTDPDNNDISYYVEWGDDIIDNWTEYHLSGKNIILKHTWEEQGDYIIRAKTKDIHGVESDWATLEVSMPKAKTFDLQLLFHQFLENHPHMFPLLRQLLGL